MKISSFFLLVWVGLQLGFASSLSAQSNSDCLTCHSDKSLSKESNGKQISLFVDEKAFGHSVHKDVRCISCHSGFSVDNIPHKAKIEPVACFGCHKDVSSRHPFHPQMAQAIRNGNQPDVSCQDCHGNHSIDSVRSADFRFSSSKVVDACGECHSDVKEDFLASSHGKANAAGIVGAPNCLTCHRNELTGNETAADSLGHKIAEEKMCLACHLDNPDVRARTSPSAGFIAAYEQSVHGTALRKGNPRAANCIDCHGSHQMKKGIEPTAWVNKSRLAETCSKCHPEIAAKYRQSVHGVAVEKGNKDAPTCTNCHGEHNILKHNDPRSPVASQNLSAQVCSPCHSSLALSTKYGLSSDRFKTFSDSYHGLAIREGSVQVANCASCHGAHDIKPSADSTSSINRANLARTCGKCHPGANERFSIGVVHVNMATQEEPMLYWIATGYVWLIVVVVGGMILHNVFDFIKKSKRKLHVRRGYLPHETFGHNLYLRMTKSERLQHLSLLVSFTVLVVTGFMLRFPDSWWVMAIRQMSDTIFEWRSVIHRCAAVVMVAAGVYHLYYITVTPRGRELIRDLLPKLQDGRDAINVLKYNFGFIKEKPAFGRFSYIEKSEYWALIWGTMVMAATGIVMWFDNLFIGLLTKLGYDVSRTVHYYEAWLATLAIVVWHLYFVIFNPDVYPINLAFWKGTLTEEEMADEHPRELEELKKQEFLADMEGSDSEVDAAHPEDGK